MHDLRYRRLEFHERADGGAVERSRFGCSLNYFASLPSRFSFVTFVPNQQIRRESPPVVDTLDWTRSQIWRMENYPILRIYSLRRMRIHERHCAAESKRL